MRYLTPLLQACTLLLIPLSLAAPANPLALIPRACATTCGSDCYTSSQISKALSKGYAYYKAGSKAGSSKYPEKYNDYEGFSFNGVSGPYYEFPILESGVYTGGEPGADRIVFNSAGTLAGEITHTGASGDDFVGCTGTS